MVQLSHSYMTTGKTIALTIQTFVGKVMSLLFNMLSRFVIAFLPREKIKSIDAVPFQAFLNVWGPLVPSEGLLEGLWYSERVLYLFDFCLRDLNPELL